MECYLLSEPKIRGYRKRMLSLWLQKGIFWVSEQRLVDQANTIRRNSWMTELEIEELERKVPGSDSVIVEEARSVEALPDHAGEDVKNVLPEMGVEKQANSLDEEEVAIVTEIAEVIERGRKGMLPALRNVSKKKLLEETAKVDKVLSKFIVIKELKQRITGITTKVRMYQVRVDSHRQNRLFENNQRQFYRELDWEEERCDDDQPVAEESKQFWGNIWSQSADHKKDAKWLQDLQSEVNVKKLEKIDITTGSLKKILGRMPNWKSPGPDLV